jgi:DNA-binding MarR family transcriptional regulator
MPETTGLFFSLFNEMGIIEQLARAQLEARLPDGLITPHFTVLNHLVRVQDGRTPLDLARAFQVPKTTMTHTLAGLEGLGLVEMRPNPDDKRSKQVWLTEAGRRLREGTIAALIPEFADLARDFPAERVAAVLPALIELRQIMDARRDRKG